MNDTTYNGWTNYATWRVNLEIFDGCEAVEMFDLTLDAYDLGQDLKAYAEEVIEMSVADPNAPSLALDYARAFLQDVNWREIAQHMIDDYIAEANE
jgi:hypothetical protein